jgi:hypothetical protein
LYYTADILVDSRIGAGTVLLTVKRTLFGLNRIKTPKQVWVIAGKKGGFEHPKIAVTS